MKSFKKLLKTICKMEDQNDNSVDVNTVAFLFSKEKLLIPCTDNVPKTFIEMLGNVDANTVERNEFNTPINIIFEDIIVFKDIQNHMFLDVLISYIAKDIDIVQLCSLTNTIPEHINISKDTVIKCLKTHIDNVGTDTYVWNQMANKTEYTFYQYRKRNWPVKKHNNIDWQTIAKKIGLVEKVYPCEAARVRGCLIPLPADSRRLIKLPNSSDEHKEPEEYKEVKFHGHIDPALEVNRLNEQEEGVGRGSDNDDDDDDDDVVVDLLQLLNDKEKYAKREEKLMKLRLESNYSTYGIPDIKEIESRIGFTKKDVINVFDAAISIGQRELALLYACRLMVSRKYYHLAIKNVPFMERINKLIGENLRIHKLIKYVMSYSFYMMLKEERLLGRKITKNNRSIMDEDEFRALPVFSGELEESPYCTEIYHDRKEKNLREQLPMYLHGERKFTDKKEFNKRLNILTGNMLKDIDLSDHNAFLTGSSLVPCVVTNPLEENTKNSANPFAAYLENYYPSYDSVSSHRKRFDEAKKGVINLFDESFKNQPLNKLIYTDIKDDDVFVTRVSNMSNDTDNRFTDKMHEMVNAVVETYNEFLLIEKKNN